MGSQTIEKTISMVQLLHAPFHYLRTKNSFERTTQNENNKVKFFDS